jgi:hypothetical protein
MFSNDSDPFSKSNYNQFLQVYDFLLKLGIKPAIQTRGGDNARGFIESLDKTLVYISATTDNERIRKEAEPSATCLEDRKDLILAAKQAGHAVVVGINPFVDEFWADPYGFADWLIDNQVNRVWFGTLHISPMQRKNIKPAKLKRFSDVITEAGKRGKRESDVSTENFCRYMDEIGINVFEHGQSSKGYFWQEYFDIGGAWMPTTDEFLSRLHDISGDMPVAFDFDAFNDWANRVIPDHEASAFKDYLVSFGRTIRSGGEKGLAYSFRDVHEYYWRVNEFATPLRSDFVGTLYDRGNDFIYTDRSGRDILVYDPDKSRENLIDISDCSLVLLNKEVQLWHQQGTEAA